MANVDLRPEHAGRGGFGNRVVPWRSRVIKS